MFGGKGMPINPQLLIAAPMLQDYLVDKTTGLPLANGMVTCFQDNSRTTLKNWYYQTGTPGNYTYITLPNPLTLSAVGTIVDNNGNDTIPFFYPYSEADNTTLQPYYITVVNSNGQSQSVRQNFPFLPSKTPSGTSTPTLRNLIANNEFWRNRGSIALTSPPNSIVINGVTLHYDTICPDQHDGFTMSDIQFFKNTTDAVDTITFYGFVIDTVAGKSFADQVIPNDITPEFYLNMNCSGTGTETTKYVQVPIQLNVDSLSGLMQCSIAIDAMAVTGNPSITISVFQYLGSGVTSPAAVLWNTISLTQNWQKYIIPFNFPSAQNLTVGTGVSAGRDDAFYLQIGFPTGSGGGTYNINIAKPAVYLGNTIPTNDWKTYDEVNSIIASPRTGDFRLGLNTSYYSGWVPCNNGSIGSPSSGGTTLQSAYTWALYNLLWNNVNNTFAPVAGGRGGSAYADFSGNKAMTLPQVLGSVFMGLPLSQTFTYVNGTGIFTVASNANFYIGAPVYLTNTGGAIPSGFALNTIYYAIPITSGTTTIQVATTYANAIAGTAFIPVSDNGSGTNTLNFALAGQFGQALHTMTTNELVSHTHTAELWSTTAGNTHFSTFDSGTDTGNTATTNSTGSSAPFNIVQPSLYTNVFLKL